MHWLRCRIDDKTRARRRRRPPTRSRPRSTRSPPRRSARCCPPRTPRTIEHELARRLRRHARPDLPAALRARCSSRGRARRSRSRTRSPATGPRWELPRRLRRLDRVRPPLHARPGLRRGRARPGDPRDRRRLDAVRRRPAEGRACCASRATATAAGARQRRGAARSPCCRARSPASTRVTNPHAGGRRRRRRAPRRTRASARRWRSARATARSPPRTSSSSPARRPRASRARSASPPRDGGAGAAAPRPARATRPTAGSRYDELVPDEELLTEVAEYLDERRLIGTTVQLLPVRYRGLSVVVNLQASPLADTARVEEDVAHALYTYLNPLVGGNPTGPGEGWDFGRALNQGELYGVVHAVDGVEFVKILRIYETNLQTGEQSAKPAGTHIVLEPRRADRLRPAHRQGHAPRGLGAGQTRRWHGANGDGTAATTRPSSGAGFGTLMIQPVGGPAGDAGGRLQPRATCAAGCRRSTRRATSGCASSARSRSLLDPIVAILDGLPAHFDPDLAPRDILDLLAAWLGVDLDESQPITAPARDGAPRRRARAAGAAPSPGSSSRWSSRSRTSRCASRTRAACAGTPDAAPGRGASAAVRRLLRQADHARSPGRDRPLHRAGQAGTHLLPPAREGTEEEGRRHENLPELRHWRTRTTGTSASAASTCAGSPPASSRPSRPRWLRRPPRRPPGRPLRRPLRPTPRRRRAPAEPPPRRRRRPRRRPPASASAPPPAARAAAPASRPPRHRSHPPTRSAAAAPPPPPPPARGPGRPPASRPAAPAAVRRRAAGPAGAEPRARARAITLRLPDGDADTRRDARRRRRARPARPRAGARAQPERHRRQLPAARRGPARRLVVDLPRTRSTSSRSAPAAPTSRRWRSTSTRRARRGRGARSGTSGRRALEGAATRPAAGRRSRSASSPTRSPRRSSRPSVRRAAARRTFDVTVSNKANAPVAGRARDHDPDDELRVRLHRPPSEIPPGETITTSKMQVRPPKQIWIGRPVEHRLRGPHASPARRPRSCSPPSDRPPRAEGPAGRGPQAEGCPAPQHAEAPASRAARVKPQVSGPRLQIGPERRLRSASRSCVGPQMQGPRHEGARTST